MSSSQDYDYIIVGAGSAGCTLAGRLTEDRDVRVLLLEAGGWDRDPWIHIPMGVGRMFPARHHDWGYDTQPEPTLDNRSIECARGKVIGGSSSVNVMAYVRGHRADFDRWAAAGLPEWSYAHVLPYFRRAESWVGGADSWRGGDGPLTVRETRYDDPLITAFMAACKAAGYRDNPDYNGARQEGFGLLQQTIRNGRRCSAAVAYLAPARRRPNLTVAVEALTTRVLIENGCATGVEYVKDGRTQVAGAAREVIVSSGAINSPQLLMLSGIGDPEVLQQHGIAVAAPLPGVGRNLQDHISVAVNFARKTPGPFARAMRLDRLGLAVLRAHLFGTGFASDLPVGATAFLKSAPDVPLPDVQFLFLAAAFPNRPYLPPFTSPLPDGFNCRAVLLRPQSRGTVSLASSDPQAHPRIQQNFLATERDRETLRAGFGMIRKVAAQPAMAPFVAAEIAPGPDVSSPEAIDAYIRATAVTAHHPMGTCRMGAASDPLAVVDPRLRVKGIAQLRVVDASVMPDLVGGNINAAVIMIAEKAADMISGRAALPAAIVSREAA